MSRSATDIDALKDRLKATWMTGDFGRIAKGYEAGAAEFVRRLGFAAGTRILDVACGTGNLALPAARAGASVTGVDNASPPMTASARGRWSSAPAPMPNAKGKSPNSVQSVVMRMGRSRIRAASRSAASRSRPDSII